MPAPVPPGLDVDLHYQPIIRPHTGSVVGVEALVRGRIEGRSVQPRTLLHRLRSQGFDITEFLCERVVADLRRLDATKSCPVWCAINVDAVDLRVLRLEELVSCAVDAVGAERIVVELTEVQEVEADMVRTVVEPVRALGVRIALDDFGSGASTLDQFDLIRPDILKIDREFVAGLDGPRANRSMVEVTVGLARAANIEVIAEGVERVEQLAVVRRLGCDYVQGFALSAALPIHALERLLLANVAGLPLRRPGALDQDVASTAC